MTFSIIAKKECDLRIAIAEILQPDPDRLIFHKLCMDWDGNWRIYTYIYQGIFPCGGNYPLGISLGGGNWRVYIFA